MTTSWRLWCRLCQRDATIIPCRLLHDDLLCKNLDRSCETAFLGNLPTKRFNLSCKVCESRGEVERKYKKMAVEPVSSPTSFI